MKAGRGHSPLQAKQSNASMDEHSRRGRGPCYLHVIVVDDIKPAFVLRLGVQAREQQSRMLQLVRVKGQGSHVCSFARTE